MKKIIYKELMLGIHPSMYIFTLLSALLLVPSYPYSVGMSYCVFGLISTFNVMKANKDYEFTAMLPVSREQIVAGKAFAVIFPELLQLLAAVPFALLSSFVLNKSGNPVGLDANMTFFGFVLINYSAFNLVFLPWYFKTAYKLGLPLMAGLAVYVLLVALEETLVATVPGLAGTLDGVSRANAGYRAAVLAIGLAIYAASCFLIVKLSVKNFRNVSIP